MTTNINSYILGDSTVQNTNLHNSVFGSVSGTAVAGNTQFTLTTSGDLTGGGTITLGSGGTLNINYTAPAFPTNISTFTNDSGYLTSFTETDPTVPAHVKAISSTNINNWNTAYGWGDHSLEGYLTSFTETDPVFQAHPVYAVTNIQITEWNTAYGWGDHSLEGYLTSFTETDPTVPTYVKAISVADINSWTTAYGWGDHSLTGYITDLTGLSTSDLAEGSNEYFTQTRARTAISVTGDLAYNNTTGVISYTTPTLVSSFTNDAGYITANTDNYANALAFSISTGVLTVGRTGTLSDLTVDLDGRYQLTGTFAETDTLDSVTSRGNTTSNNITVNDLLVSGDLTVSGTTTTVLSQNTRINENLLYLNEGGESVITNAVGNGTTVTFTADNTYSVGYTVDITGATPSSFNLVDAYVTASDSTTFTVTSTVTDTYVSGGEAYGHAHVNVDLGWGGAYDDGTYAHAGFFRDATDGRFKAFDSYTVEPNESVDINVSHASFNLADIQANAFIGNATSASILATARDIALVGDVTGTASFNGSSDISITATVTNDSHAHTTATITGIEEYIQDTVGAMLLGDGATSVAYNDTVGTLTISSTDTDTNTDTFVSSAVFNTSNGVLTLTRNDSNITTVDLDGRYTDNIFADTMNQNVRTTDSPTFANVTATNFNGTATTAKYADLAEKYTTQFDHPIGTVMMVSFEGDYEATPVNLQSYPIGVVSENPAFLMNDDCDGQALALKGRVPVRVVDPIKKGELVYVFRDGTASNIYTGAQIVGIALETNEFSGEKLVECVLKL
ncbi:hypothetical protein N9R43_01960 [bacterium]|nr:hypothetical protein [bacterium]